MTSQPENAVVNFSVRTLLVSVGILAVALGIIVAESSALACCFNICVHIYVFTLPLGIIYRQGRERASAIGSSLCGISYLCITTWKSDFLDGDLASFSSNWMASNIRGMPPGQVDMAFNIFSYVGVTRGLFILLSSIIGGFIAVKFYYREDSTNQPLAPNSNQTLP